MNRVSPAFGRALSSSLCLALIGAAAFSLKALAVEPVFPSPLAAALTQADENDVLLSPQSLCVTSGGSDGHPQLQMMLDHVRRMKSYCFDSVLTTYKGDKQIVEVGKVYFKSPNLIRFEVIKSGSRSGAVVVRQPDGKIRGQMGGLFRGLKMTLAPDSKILKSANGFSIAESDLESLLVGIEHMLKGDLKLLSAAAAPGRPALMEVVQGRADLIDRIAVDARTNAPGEWNIFENNKLFSVLKLNNIETRNDLPDSLFIIGEYEGTKSFEFSKQNSHSDTETLNNLNDHSALSPQVCREVSCLMDEAGKIRDSAPEKVCDKSGEWLPAARETLLTNGTRLEAIIYQLSNFGKAISNTSQGKAEAQSIADDWTRSISMCRNSASSLLELVLAEKPDAEAIQTASSNLKDSVQALQAASKRAERLL